MIEREVKVIAPILAELKALSEAFSSPVQAISVELLEVGLIVGNGKEAGSRHPPDEDGGFYPFLCYRFPWAIR